MKKINLVHEFAHWYYKGMNLVYKDTASFRSKLVLTDGPHSQVDPYNPLYLSDPSTSTRLLEISTQNLLPNVQIDEECPEAPLPSFIQEYKNTPLEAVPPEQHVLPLPLIDIIIATSHVKLDSIYWYASPLREKWAEYTLRVAKEFILKSKANSAAINYASVFGTCLPGFLAEDPSDTAMFRKAWQGLSVLVDQKVFVTALLKAFSGKSEVNKSGESLFSQKNVQAMLGKYVKISPRRILGPDILLEAEKIFDMERKICEFEKQLAEGLPIGIDGNVDFVQWKEGEHKFKFASEMFQFERKSIIYNRSNVSIASVAWIFYNGELKALLLPNYFALGLERKCLMEFPTETDKKKTIDFSKAYEKEWKVTVLKRRYDKHYSHYDSEYSLLETPVQFSEQEKAQLPLASKERLQGYYNGRHEAIQHLEKLKKNHRKMVESYMKKANKKS